jgi:hypothetical protein
MFESKRVGFALALAFGVALAAPAAAQTAQPKKKPPVARSAAPAAPLYRGTDKFRAGPIYHGTDWLGDDPDPFIRLQIARDPAARYGGNF